MRGKRQLRPLWQIALLLPIWPLYAGARWFVEFMDRHL
jgi:hypothetical protein